MTYLSIPIPANTRGVPQSSYGPASPQAALSTSPRNTFATPNSFAGSLGTSPGAHLRHRSASGNVHSIARALTAFLPPDYPLAEEPEGVATNKRQGKQKILFLENINLDAANFLKQSGFEVRSSFVDQGFILTLIGRSLYQGFQRRRAHLQTTWVYRCRYQE